MSETSGNGKPRLPRPKGGDNGSPNTPAKRSPPNPLGKATLLDERLLAEIGIALSILPSPKRVYRLLGIGSSTWYDWRKRGRDPEEQNPIFRRFVETLDAADTVFERARLETILEAARDYEEEETIVADVVDAEGRPTGRKKVTRKRKKMRGDWRAAAWILERSPRTKERYAAKTEVEHGGELTLVAALSRLAHGEKDEPKELPEP